MDYLILFNCWKDVDLVKKYTFLNITIVKAREDTPLLEMINKCNFSVKQNALSVRNTFQATHSVHFIKHSKCNFPLGLSRP